MLNIYYQYDMNDTLNDNILDGIDSYFDLFHETDWFNDPTVRQIILEIDNTKVIEDDILKSQVLGKCISPTELSTGAKGLILMLKDDRLSDKIFLSDRFGENCFKWIFEISKSRDINLVLTSWFLPPVEMCTSSDYNVRFVNKNLTFNNLMDVWREIIQHMHDGNDNYPVEIYEEKN